MSFAQFRIWVPVERVDAVAQCLRDAGVWFDPEGSMVALPLEHAMNGIMNGGVGETVIEAINEKMAGESPPNRIVRAFSEMTYEERYALLVLGTEHADWDSEQQMELEEVDVVEWRKFLDRYPELAG